MTVRDVLVKIQDEYREDERQLGIKTTVKRSPYSVIKRLEMRLEALGALDIVIPEEEEGRTE